jgi:hypothetical protein
MAQRSETVDSAAMGREPRWKLPRDAPLTPPYAPTNEQLEAAMERSELRMWDAMGAISPSEDRRFGADEPQLVIRQPLWRESVCGTLALLLISGQFWLAELCRAVGWEPGGWAPWLRVAVLELGACLLFLAVPVFKPAGWTPAQQAEEDAAHAYFRGKRGT